MNPPGWVGPQRLPDDLPPHEQWVQAQPVEVYGAPARHPPQTAPGFVRAQRLGLLPKPPPDAPPSPLPGLSAGLMLALALAGMFGPALLLAVLPPLAVLPVGLGGWLAAVRLLQVLPRREEAEAAAGYVSSWGAPGLWRLSPLGRPARPPDRTLLPPGFYPSPYWPGVLQKWEGTHWKPFSQRWYRRADQWFRTPDRPYL